MLTAQPNFYLFCKSYCGDLMRVAHLVDSIDKHNVDNIPLYICVPSSDLTLFQEKIIGYKTDIRWLTDEEVVLANPRGNLSRYYSWDGRLSQQVIKSDFWRIFQSENLDINYLCMDSESIFVRDFYVSDFMVDGSVPYTVIHQNKELLQLAANKKIDKVIHNFKLDCAAIKKIFNRKGVDYEFGPTPTIWSSLVWKDLDIQYFQKNNLDIWTAVELMPTELRWYGEALLRYKTIPIYPIEPIFRVYHYDWQYFSCKKLGDSEKTIKACYLGMLKQSNWDYANDYGPHLHRKNIFSRVVRVMRRFLSRFR